MRYGASSAPCTPPLDRICSIQNFAIDLLDPLIHSPASASDLFFAFTSHPHTLPQDSTSKCIGDNTSPGFLGQRFPLDQTCSATSIPIGSNTLSSIHPHATMPPPLHSASPTPGPSGVGRKRDRTADALYSWCIENHEPGYVFSQDELLNAGIIPDRKLEILLTSTQHLVNRALFKLHDRAGGTIGWELVEEQTAKKYSLNLVSL